MRAFNSRTTEKKVRQMNSMQSKRSPANLTTSWMERMPKTGADSAALAPSSTPTVLRRCRPETFRSRSNQIQQQHQGANKPANRRSSDMMTCFWSVTEFLSNSNEQRVCSSSAQAGFGPKCLLLGVSKWGKLSQEVRNG